MFSLKWSNMLSQLCASHKYDRFKIVCWVCFVRSLWIHLKKVFVTEYIIHVTAHQLEVLSLKSFAICKPFNSFYSQMRLKYIIKDTVILKSEMLLQQLVVLRGSHQLKLWLKVGSFLISPDVSIVYWSARGNLASKWWLSSCYDSVLWPILRDSLCLRD